MDMEMEMTIKHEPEIEIFETDQCIKSSSQLSSSSNYNYAQDHRLQPENKFQQISLRVILQLFLISRLCNFAFLISLQNSHIHDNILLPENSGNQVKSINFNHNAKPNGQTNKRKSSAEIMREYRKRRQQDPVKYHKYLESERLRNKRRRRYRQKYRLREQTKASETNSNRIVKNKLTILSPNELNLLVKRDTVSLKKTVRRKHSAPINIMNDDLEMILTENTEPIKNVDNNVIEQPHVEIKEINTTNSTLTETTIASPAVATMKPVAPQLNEQTDFEKHIDPSTIPRLNGQPAYLNSFLGFVSQMEKEKQIREKLRLRKILTDKKIKLLKH